MTWWCTTHKRVARRVRKNQFGEDEAYCGEPGIMLPCVCKDVFMVGEDNSAEAIKRVDDELDAIDGYSRSATD